MVVQLTFFLRAYSANIYQNNGTVTRIYVVLKIFLIEQVIK